MDAALYIAANEPILHQQFENRPSGFRELLTWVNRQNQALTSWFCLEYTGAADRGHLCLAALLLSYPAKTSLLVTVRLTGQEIHGYSAW